MDIGRQNQQLTTALCMRDMGLVFSYKFNPTVGRLCLLCMAPTHSEAKRQWWSAGSHFHIKRDYALGKTRCLRCKKRLAHTMLAIACSECTNKILQMDDEDVEAFEAGVPLNTEDTFRITELENTTSGTARMGLNTY
ncbi:uncharacterized protein LOC143266191 [Megachile rotundata]|uniref:uncharacterized protein LOC143266191 n=1 Tax=Megachile rotundata TaxID=143995 RepID=UPI003FD5949E